MFVLWADLSELSLTCHWAIHKSPNQTMSSYVAVSKKCAQCNAWLVGGRCERCPPPPAAPIVNRAAAAEHASADAPTRSTAHAPRKNSFTFWSTLEQTQTAGRSPPASAASAAAASAAPAAVAPEKFGEIAPESYVRMVRASHRVRCARGEAARRKTH